MKASVVLFFRLRIPFFGYSTIRRYSMARPATRNLFGESTAEPSETLDPALAPLAERMRPRSLEEFVGQDHLVGRGSHPAKID